MAGLAEVRRAQPHGRRLLARSAGEDLRPAPDVGDAAGFVRIGWPTAPLCTFAATRPRWPRTSMRPCCGSPPTSPGRMPRLPPPGCADCSNRAATCGTSIDAGRGAAARDARPFSGPDRARLLIRRRKRGAAAHGRDDRPRDAGDFSRHRQAVYRDAALSRDARGAARLARPAHRAARGGAARQGRSKGRAVAQRS